MKRTIDREIMPGEPVAPFRSDDPFGTAGKLPVPDPFNPDEIRRTETTQTEKLVYATATGGCYNGNISLRTVPGGTYAYVYDTYNRLVSASFSAAEGSTGDYSAEYAYDGHANITSLTRRGVTDTYGGTVTFGLLDGITATLQGNRVTALELSTEAASYEGRTGYGLEGSYTLAYDDNGNVVSDGSRGISSISYNRHDQPVVITFSDGRRITNSYDDAGTLVSRTLRTGGRLPRTTTERYAGPHVGAMAANAVPAVGRSYFEGGYFDADGKVHYFVTDYQGNVLEDRKARGTVVASTGYYPYGEPWTEPRGGNDRWFGGKERLAAEGLPMSDFGPRLLNHAYPGWHTQDRKLEDYYPLSPYSFCAGNPVRYIDPTGEKFTKAAEDASVRLVVWSLIMMTNVSEEKYNKYNSVINEQNMLRSSNQLYDVRDSADPQGRGSTTYDVKTDAVVMAIPGNSKGDIELISHEFHHSYQFETGEVELSNSKDYVGYLIAYDIYDEEEAYNRGKLFGGQGMALSEIENNYPKLLKNATSISQGIESISKKTGWSLSNDNDFNRFSNITNRAFRINKKTYRPKSPIRR